MLAGAAAEETREGSMQRVSKFYNQTTLGVGFCLFFKHWILKLDQSHTSCESFDKFLNLQNFSLIKENLLRCILYGGCKD